MSALTPADDWEKIIRTTIPLADFMEISITSLTRERIHCEAPLKPNINIHHTGFAGSLYSLCTIAAWTLLNHYMKSQSFDATIVLRSGNIRYFKPVSSTISIHSDLPGSDFTRSFLDTYKSKGKSRLSITSRIIENDECLVEFTGEFTAINKT